MLRIESITDQQTKCIKLTPLEQIATKLIPAKLLIPLEQIATKLFHFPTGHTGRQHFSVPFSSKKDDAIDLWPMECDQIEVGHFHYQISLK